MTLYGCKASGFAARVYVDESRLRFRLVSLAHRIPSFLAGVAVHPVWLRAGLVLARLALIAATKRVATLQANVVWPKNHDFFVADFAGHFPPSVGVASSQSAMSILAF